MGEMELGKVAVSEVMNTDPPLVETTAGLCRVARLLRRQSHVWVVKSKEDREVVGIVTERDFLDLLSPLPDMMYTTGVLHTKSLYHGEVATVQEFMTSPVVSCSPQDTVEKALEVLWQKRIRRLAVIEGGQLVGELSMKGIIAAYYIAACSMRDGA